MLTEPLHIFLIFPWKAGMIVRSLSDSATIL